MAGSPQPTDRQRESLRDQSREWLRSVIARTGRTANAIAEDAGVSPSNLHKLLNKPDWPYPLKPGTMQKISNATGIPLPWDMPGQAPGFSDVEIEMFEGETAESLPFSGRNGADWWEVKTRLLDLEGYLPGDAVLVSLNETARAGDIVIAQVTAGPGGEVETVFRKYEPPFLTCRTTETRYPRPELVDGDRVIIMGVVTNAWRERARSAA